MNANIIKMQNFYDIKFDLKGHLDFVKSFCDCYFLL